MRSALIRNAVAQTAATNPLRPLSEPAAVDGTSGAGEVRSALDGGEVLVVELKCEDDKDQDSLDGSPLIENVPEHVTVMSEEWVDPEPCTDQRKIQVAILVVLLVALIIISSLLGVKS
jgi:hypothetical protein